MKEKKHISIFALAATGNGISGSDRIFIELAKRWCKEIDVSIYVTTEGYDMCQRQNATGEHFTFQISSIYPWKKMGFVIHYIVRIFQGIVLGLRLSVENSPTTIVYAASEFWMDALPAIFLKMRFPKIKLIGTWFQTAPSPLKGFSEGEREDKHYLWAFAYWFVQIPIKSLLARHADFVIVNNESERKQFPKLNEKNRIIVMLGGINYYFMKNWMKRHPAKEKKYEGIFQGRFHPQKGVSELIDIWAKVVKKKPTAILAMIGDGPLMPEVKRKLKAYNLEKNVTLFGFMFDGDEKFRIFQQGKIAFHPAFYDSGGMAAAETMVFGSPCVAFDLVSYQSYYPQGMVKVKIGDLDAFTKVIIRLIDDKNYYKKMKLEAENAITEKWDWQYHADRILHVIAK